MLSLTLRFNMKDHVGIFVVCCFCAASGFIIGNFIGFDLGMKKQRENFTIELKKRGLIEFVVDEELQVQWKFKK
jgi:uncharacterized membrane protein